MNNLKQAHSYPLHLGGVQEHIPRMVSWFEKLRSQDLFCMCVCGGGVTRTQNSPYSNPASET